VGVAQAVALVPGVSRSGITITAGLAVGLTREAAARFSFLLSIPVIALSGGLEVLHLWREGTGGVGAGPMLLGFVVSAVSAYLCIRYFLAFLQRHGMGPFVAYRVALGVVILVVLV
jgi:undecaprenyl-diphosphatase